MKRNLFLVGLALGTALTLVSCSQSSPTAPKVPTPAASTVTITASPSVAGINEGILLVAQVSAGSGSVPDGTSVTFTTTIGFFVENGLAIGTTETRTTSGGRATATLVSTSPGDGTVTARVPNSSSSTVVHFRGVAASQIAITSVLPNRGKPQGGDQVTISGQGFVTPLVVSFIVAGTAYPATVTAVAVDGSSITALTPQVPTSSSDQLASVQVTLTGVVAPGGGPVSATLANAFTYTSASDAGIPQLYSVVPNSGSSNGGEIITLTGKYFTEPLQVSFVFAAATVPGQVTSVQHGADGIDVAQVVTPKVTIAGRTTVNITITNMVGSPSSKSATFIGVFTFNPPVTGPPVIYYISPTYGSAAGNDTVTIFGANFAAPASVSIGPTSEIVQSISTDGTSITILTRPVAGAVPTDPQDVTVTTAQGTVTLSKAFTYLEGQTPTLYVLTPNIGPLEGGTRVTISGAGFQYPVQVLFTVTTPAGPTPYQAQVVSNNFNQVVCISPSITPSGLTNPSIAATVTVTNVGSGKVSAPGLTFTYGQAMFISGISPTQGPMDTATTVTITGQGFVSPVSVIATLTGAAIPSVAWNVLSVAGTQIVAQAVALPANARSCSPITATVLVTNLDSNLKSNPGTFTYQAVQPLITSVQIGASGNMVQQYQPVGTVTCTTPWTSNQVTINGSGFSTAGVSVSFGGLTPVQVPPANITANTIKLYLSDLSAITMQWVTCTTGGGACGQQWVATPVDVSVTNNNSGCPNTLSAAIVINPCNTSCRTALTSLAFTPAPGTTQTSGVSFPLSLAFTPSPTTAPASVSLSYVGFSGSPSNALIPAGATSPIVVPVTLTNTGSASVTGNIIASTGGGGSCAALTVTSAPITVLPLEILTVNLVGSAAGNSVSSSPGGIACTSGTCNASFVLNTPVTLGAIASLAVTYSGDCSNASALSSNSITMNANKTCTVTFHAPTVTSLNVTTGPIAGGTAVTITGSGFANGATVTFGGTAATGVTVVNPTTITCTTPAQTSGAVDVVVTNLDGQAGTLPGGFTYS